MGFLATNSHQMAPMIPNMAKMALTTMSGDPNQSSSSPRSSIICKLPSPSAMNPSPG